MKWNYDNLRTGDIIGTTDVARPFTYLEGFVLGGFRGMLNLKEARHIIVAYRSGGLCYGMEMRWPKIHVIDLNVFEGPTTKRVVWVGRDPRMSGNEGRALDFLETSHEKIIKYDLGELLKFWKVDVLDSPKKWICSVLPREMYTNIGLDYPAEWNKKVAPREWQYYKQMQPVDYRMK